MVEQNEVRPASLGSNEQISRMGVRMEYIARKELLRVNRD
jgi:hypothetical protein